MSIKLKGSTDGSVTLQAPADTSPTGTDKTLTLPTTTGSANQFVKNGGTAGELEYSSMVETSTGQLLVGATSGTGKFIVQDSSLPKIQANYGGTKHFEAGVGGSGCGLAMTTGHFMTVNHQPYADRGTDSNLSERIRIHPGGQLTITNQPIASLSHSGAPDLTNVVLTSANFYDHTWVNQGSHFVASTGRFTCPVAGIYRIYFRATNDRANFNVRLQKNGTTVNEAFGDVTSAQSSVSSEAIVSCAANDYLQIQLNRLKAVGGTQHKQVTFQLIA